MKHIRTFCLLTGTALLLAACSDAKKELGLQADPPDEFTVVTRAPLSVPPDYTLRPPRPGAQRPMELNVREEARKTVFGAQDTAAAPARSTGQENFLGRLGASDTNNTIRQTVDTESKTIAAEEKPVAEKLLFWKKSTAPEGKVIDPVEEKKRLDEQKGVTVEKRNEDILEDK